MCSKIERRIAAADTSAGSASRTRTTGSSFGYRGDVANRQSDGEGRSFATPRRPISGGIKHLLMTAILIALCAATNAQVATSPAPATAEHFSEAVVTIRIDAEDKISLDPESAIIFFDPLLRDPRKARQVRWLVACEDGLIMPGGTIGRCPREDEMVVVRPDRDQPDELRWMFSHQREDGPWQECMVIPERYNSIASGLPLSPQFGELPSIGWVYEVELWRSGTLATSVQGLVWIEENR